MPKYYFSYIHWRRTMGKPHCRFLFFISVLLVLHLSRAKLLKLKVYRNNGQQIIDEDQKMLAVVVYVANHRPREEMSERAYGTPHARQ